MILIEYRRPDVKEIYLFPVDKKYADSLRQAKEYAQKMLGKSAEIIRGYSAGTYQD